jgi:hypothetical protein
MMINRGEDRHVPGFKEFIYPVASFIKTECALFLVQIRHFVPLTMTVCYICFAETLCFSGPNIAGNWLTSSCELLIHP